MWQVRLQAESSSQTSPSYPRSVAKGDFLGVLWRPSGVIVERASRHLYWFDSHQSEVPRAVFVELNCLLSSYVPSGFPHTYPLSFLIRILWLSSNLSKEGCRKVASLRDRSLAHPSVWSR